jgi:hypothetical protein
VIRSFLQRAAPEPEYQGVHTRLAVRLVIAGAFLPLTVFAELGHGSIGQHIYTLLYPLTFCAFFEWWAVRRSGLTFSEEQLTLKYGPIYRFIPWSRINGVEWCAVGNFESLRTPGGQQVDAVTAIEVALKPATGAPDQTSRKRRRRGR